MGSSSSTYSRWGNTTSTSQHDTRSEIDNLPSNESEPSRGLTSSARCPNENDMHNTNGEISEVDANVLVQPTPVPRTEVVTENEDEPYLHRKTCISLSPEEVYPVNNPPKGHIQVINMVKWDNNVQEERVGSEKDVEAIKSVFPKYGYEVSVAENLDKTEFKKCIKTFRDDERHKKVDAAILIIMSHGGQPEPTKGEEWLFYSQSVDIFTRDNQRISSDWVVEQFASVNCPTLATKPKIIMFTSCRGDDKDFGFGIETDCISIVPKISNLLMVFPCLPDPELFTGNVSYRNAIGTWMIQEFISVLEKRWENADLETMLDEVSRNLIARYEIVHQMQVVNRNSLGFNKKLFFHQVPPTSQLPSAQ